MIQHMITSHQGKGRVLPYGRFFTLLFCTMAIEFSYDNPHYFDTLNRSTLSHVGNAAHGDDRATAQHEDVKLHTTKGGHATQIPMEDDLDIPPL